MAPFQKMVDSDERLILIVDDNPVGLDVLSNLLAGAGFEVAAAIDGPTAIELAQRDAPALILLDVRLPGIDGFEVCRRLKAAPATARIPVIFMTALMDVESRIRGLSLGAVDFITKPFHDEEILARVRTQMDLHLLTKHLVEENAVRAAAESALAGAARELEQRVNERTADLGRALVEIEQAKGQLSQLNEALRRSNDALVQEATHREEALREATERLSLELAERQRADQQRAVLREEIIAVQRATLIEMSTPLIPITRRIMVMPIIGAMTEERAEQLLETALRGVHAHGASVVIIDVTGLKAMDANVADSLVKAGRALRLLGAQAVITGVRPALARTLLAASVEIASLVTRGTLEGGIAYALERSGDADTLLRSR
jgi:DNA-binding response OmpR family regulator/anti-anti-sigma regulatory factor